MALWMRPSARSLGIDCVSTGDGTHRVGQERYLPKMLSAPLLAARFCREPGDWRLGLGCVSVPRSEVKPSVRSERTAAERLTPFRFAQAFTDRNKDAGRRTVRIGSLPLTVGPFFTLGIFKFMSLGAQLRAAKLCRVENHRFRSPGSADLVCDAPDMRRCCREDMPWQ
jgi:hypothetical protein